MIPTGHTKGHSEDSISILLDEGIALVGDLPSLALAKAYQEEKIEESWRRILAHNIHTIYYSHESADIKNDGSYFAWES